MYAHRLEPSLEKFEIKFDRHLLREDTPVPLDEATRQPQLRGSILKEKLLALQYESRVPVLNKWPLPLNSARSYAPEYTLALRVGGKSSGENAAGDGKRFVVIEPCCFSMKKSRPAATRQARQLESFYQNYRSEFYIILAGTVPRKELAEYVMSRTGVSFKNTNDQYWQIPNGSSPREKVEKSLDFNLNALIEKTDILETDPAQRKAWFASCLKKYYYPAEQQRMHDSVHVMEDLERAARSLQEDEDMLPFRDIPSLRQRILRTENNNPKTRKGSRDHIWEKQDGGPSDPANVQILRRSHHDIKSDVFATYRRKLGRPLMKYESLVLNNEFLRILKEVTAGAEEAEEPLEMEEQHSRSKPGTRELKNIKSSVVSNIFKDCDFSVAASSVLRA
ncbi:Uncharacterised protein [uncultured archaeon]|nr:Uncharacterised protein [uncultured archaeon]